MNISGRSPRRMPEAGSKLEARGTGRARSKRLGRLIRDQCQDQQRILNKTVQTEVLLISWPVPQGTVTPWYLLGAREMARPS